MTRGDALPEPDPWLVNGGADAWRFAFYVPLAGQALGGLDSTAGKMVIMGVPLALLVLATALERRWRTAAPELSQQTEDPMA